MRQRCDVISREHELTLADLLQEGAKTFVRMLREQQRVVYSEWRGALRERCQAPEKQLRWLWDSLAAEPALSALDEQFVSWREEMSEPVPVLPVGSRIGFFKSPIKDLNGRIDLARHSLEQPEFEAVLREPLKMRPGKKYYECCPVAAEIVLQKSDLTDFNGTKAVADKMRVPEKHLSETRRELAISVPSLNKSMTVARYLLRPDLTATGGNIYHYAVWLKEGGRERVPLETIRISVSDGNWKCPSEVLI